LWEYSVLIHWLQLLYEFNWKSLSDSWSIILRLLFSSSLESFCFDMKYRRESCVLLIRFLCIISKILEIWCFVWKYFTLIVRNRWESDVLLKRFNFVRCLNWSILIVEAMSGNCALNCCTISLIWVDACAAVFALNADLKLLALMMIWIWRLKDMMIALWHILLMIVNNCDGNKRRDLANKLKLVGYICDHGVQPQQIHINWFRPYGLISECFASSSALHPARVELWLWNDVICMNAVKYRI